MYGRDRSFICSLFETVSLSLAKSSFQAIVAGRVAESAGCV